MRTYQIPYSTVAFRFLRNCMDISENVLHRSVQVGASSNGSHTRTPYTSNDYMGGITIPFQYRKISAPLHPVPPSHPTPVHNSSHVTRLQLRKEAAASPLTHSHTHSCIHKMANVSFATTTTTSFVSYSSHSPSHYS